MSFDMTIVVDGITFDHNPTDYSPEVLRFGSSDRNLDGSLSSTDFIDKYRINLSNLTITNWQSLQRLFARKNKSLPYRDGVYIVQTIDGDGSETSFNLGRKAYSSATEATGWIDSVQKSVTFTTATNPGSTQIFINPATGAVTTGSTANDNSDNIEIYYIPIFTMKLIDPKLSYHPNVIYEYVVTFEEV